MREVKLESGWTVSVRTLDAEVFDDEGDMVFVIGDEEVTFHFDRFDHADIPPLIEALAAAFVELKMSPQETCAQRRAKNAEDDAKAARSECDRLLESCFNLSAQVEKAEARVRELQNAEPETRC